MKTVNVQQAKTHLSRLLEEAVSGGDIVIAKAGRPYVRLTPCLPEREPRTLGGWEGRVWVAGDFDEEDEVVTALFEGRAGKPTDAKGRRPGAGRAKTQKARR